MNIKHQVLAGMLGASSIVAATATAETITGDEFEATLTVDGTTYGAPFAGEAGKAGDDILGILEDPNLPGFYGEFTVNWVDEDSVDVQLLIGGLGHDLDDASFTVSGLDFMLAGQPSNILSVKFNRGASQLNFADRKSLVGPALSFTPTSFTGVLSMGNGLVGDGPTLRYDLIFANAAVPEPGTLALLGLGLGLGLARPGLGRRRGA